MTLTVVLIFSRRSLLLMRKDQGFITESMYDKGRYNKNLAPVSFTGKRIANELEKELH